jgi:hypothetical protein
VGRVAIAVNNQSNRMIKERGKKSIEYEIESRQ